MEEEFIATLLFPDEYRRQLNQVAGLTSRYIKFLKSKFGSVAGGEIIEIPIEQCTSITYKDNRPVYIIIGGVLLSIVAPLSLYIIATGWETVSSEVIIPIGALFVGTLFGLRMTFGARRHELTFLLKNDSRIKWRSRPGDFKYKQGSVDKILEFARARGLLVPIP